MANARPWMSVAVAEGETRPILLKTEAVRPSRNGNCTYSARFEAFEVNFASREVRKHGLRIRIAQKPFQILELLLQEPGNVVSRKTLREKLWPDTHVGYEHSLNTAVNTLRELLGDSAQNPRYIETLPRVGYRFVAAVHRPQAAAARQMLLVLPFSNLTGESNQDVFVDGLNEELTQQLATLDAARFGVIARTTAARYKSTEKSVAEIASELCVDYVVEGSIRGQSPVLRIAVHLIHAPGQSSIWSGSFDCVLAEALKTQSEIAQRIREGVSGTLTFQTSAQGMPHSAA